MTTALVFTAGTLTGAIVAGVAVYVALTIRGDLLGYDRTRAAKVGVVVEVVDGLALAELGHGFTATRRVASMAAEFRTQVGDLLDIVNRQRARIVELEQLRPYAPFLSVYGAGRAVAA